MDESEEAPICSSIEEANLLGVLKENHLYIEGVSLSMIRKYRLKLENALAPLEPSRQLDFQNHIPIGHKITAKEATEALAKFHKTSFESIWAEVLNKGNVDPESVAKFVKSEANGHRVILLAITDNEGKVTTTRFHTQTGNLLPHTG